MANETPKKTFQTHILENTDDFKQFSLFLGGLDGSRRALKNFNPLKTGYGRIFMTRMPFFMLEAGDDIKAKLKKFKHILEYGNTGIAAGNNIAMQFGQLQGGYTNRQMDIPNILTDDTNEITIKTFEFSGSPMREVIQYWLTGVSDLVSGVATYHGVDLPVDPAYHTAEFIYVATDQTGQNVEYAAMYTNCFPKEIKLDQFNYESGQHELVPIDITFTCVRHMSVAINNRANKLIEKYNLLLNSLGYNSGYTLDSNNRGKYYNIDTGKFKKKARNEEYSMYGAEVNS